MVRIVGGSAGESNPPETLVTPHTDFEDRGTHQSPRTSDGFQLDAQRATSKGPPSTTKAPRNFNLVCQQALLHFDFGIDFVVAHAVPLDALNFGLISVDDMRLAFGDMLAWSSGPLLMSLGLITGFGCVSTTPRVELVYPACHNDRHCTVAGEVCVNKRCQPCREAAQCAHLGPHASCINQRCMLHVQHSLSNQPKAPRE